jgi:hypothetical protein
MLELASIVMVEGDHLSMYMHPETPGHINALFEKNLRIEPGEPEAPSQVG